MARPYPYPRSPDEHGMVECLDPEHVEERWLPLKAFKRNKNLAGGRDWKCRDCRYRPERLRSRGNRLLVTRHYVTVWVRGRPACACPGCEETDFAALTIDHLDENSPAPGMSGRKLVNWIVAHGFPDGFQILCLACNTSKRNTGGCSMDHRELQAGRYD